MMAAPHVARWGYIATNGNQQISPQFEVAGPFRGGIAPVRIDGLVGYVDATGKFQIPPVYGSNSTSFSEGTIAVELPNGMMALVNSQGELIIEREFEYAEPFSYGHALVEIEGRTTFVRHDGCESPLEIEDALSFEEGFAAVKIAGDWYFMNADGAIQFGPYNAVDSWGNGVVAVVRNGEHCILNRNGVLTEVAVDVDWCGGLPAEDRLAYRKQGLYGFMDFSGRETIEAKFDEVNFFSESIAMVQENGMWGGIDKSGEWILPPSFEEANSFSCGWCLAAQHGDSFFVDRYGIRMHVPEATSYRGFHEGLAPFAII